MLKPASSLRSAEFMVAMTLLAVCLAVGAAWWFLSARDKPATAAGAQAPAAAAPGRSDEQAALDTWNRRLQGDFTALDKQRQAQEQRSGQERKKLEAATGAAKPDQHAAAPLQLPAPAVAPPAAKAASPATPPPALPPPSRQPLRTEAGVDWSSCSRPHYPRISVERGEEGVVVLSFKVGADGALQSGAVSSSSGSSRLDNAALQALQKCRFMPATLDGAAVAASASVRFQWQLDR